MTWLPQISEFSGSWEDYERDLYDAFCKDWIFGSAPIVRGKRVAFAKQPLYKGKESTFWHLTTEGEDGEELRTPDLRRCERIRWVRALIERVDTPDTVCWANERKRQRSLLIALPDYSYLVVLRIRTGYFLLRTAYPVESERRRNDLRQEHQAYLNASRKGPRPPK